MAIHSLKDLPTSFSEIVSGRHYQGRCGKSSSSRNLWMHHRASLRTSQQGCCGHQQPRRAAQIKAWDSPVRSFPCEATCQRVWKSSPTEKTACHSFGLGRAQPTGLPAGEWTTDGQRRTGGTYGYVIKPEHCPCVGQGFWASKSVNRIPSWLWSRRWRIPLRPPHAERSFLHAMGGGCQTPYAWHPGRNPID